MSRSALLLCTIVITQYYYDPQKRAKAEVGATCTAPSSQGSKLNAPYDELDGFGGLAGGDYLPLFFYHSTMVIPSSCRSWDSDRAVL